MRIVRRLPDEDHIDRRVVEINWRYVELTICAVGVLCCVYTLYCMSVLKVCRANYMYCGGFCNYSERRLKLPVRDVQHNKTARLLCLSPVSGFSD
jgi:hypothetical protein